VINLKGTPTDNCQHDYIVQGGQGASRISYREPSIRLAPSYLLSSIYLSSKQVLFLLYFMDHVGTFEEITDNEVPSQIANFHFLENQLRTVLPKKILQLLHGYFGKCLEHNPNICFDSGLKSCVAATIFYLG
jgi:hypothetical protein